MPAKILVRAQQHILLFKKLFHIFHPHVLIGLDGTTNSYGAMVSADPIDGSKPAEAPRIICRWVDLPFR
jgi:hypothetical protein